MPDLISPEHPSLQQQVQLAVEACITLANQYFHRVFPLPEVTFRKSGKVAGSAYLGKNRVNFNPVLLEHNPDVFLTEVVPHEISHLLVHQLFGKVRPHGKEWQGIMAQVFGVAPKTTHNLDLAPLKLKEFAYQCGCQTVALSVRRHNAILRGEKRYLCKKCGKELIRHTDELV